MDSGAQIGIGSEPIARERKVQKNPSRGNHLRCKVTVTSTIACWRPWYIVLYHVVFHHRSQTLCDGESEFENVDSSNLLIHAMTITVGVLALQGAFYEHLKLLRKAAASLSPNEPQKWNFIEVRTPTELERCDGLIIPGGESTTISLVAARSQLLEPLRDFVKCVSFF